MQSFPGNIAVLKKRKAAKTHHYREIFCLDDYLSLYAQANKKTVARWEDLTVHVVGAISEYVHLPK
jgi:hypothetical protein